MSSHKRWKQAPTLRIKLVTLDNLGLMQKLILSGIKQYGKVKATNLWLLLLNNPRLMKGFIYFASRLMPYGELDRQDTELVILRVAWNCHCRYEWGQHIDIGLKTGLRIQDIRLTMQETPSTQATPKQKTLLKACDEFHQHRLIMQSTWQELSGFYDQRLLLELLVLIGFYEGLAGVLNSVGLPLDQELEALVTNVEYELSQLT